jgi:phosphatidylinositol dimannoside acyltransferase
MTIDLQRVINSSFSLRCVSALAQRIPPRFGYPISAYVAKQIAHQQNAGLVRAVRANQWVINGETLGGEALDQLVTETLRHSARCIYDLYHYIHHLDAINQWIVLDPLSHQIAQRPEFDNRGLIVVGLHLSNFDLVLQWLCKRGVKPLILTMPNPRGGRRMEYEMRKRTGMNLVPASVGGLRQALRHLQQGGLVLTGIDRPISNPIARPHFFGRPAALPMHHIFLAMKTRVPLVMMVTNFQRDGKHHVFASNFIEMDSYPNPKAGELRNAEKVLRQAEKFILRAPQQWSVPWPIWPEIMDLVPK